MLPLVFHCISSVSKYRINQEPKVSLPSNCIKTPQEGHDQRGFSMSCEVRQVLVGLSSGNNSCNCPEWAISFLQAVQLVTNDVDPNRYRRGSCGVGNDLLYKS